MINMIHPVDNILEKTFLLIILNLLLYPLDVSNAYVLQDEKIPVITVLSYRL